MPDVMPTFADVMGGGSGSTTQQPSQSNQMPSFSQVMGQSSSSAQMPSINDVSGSTQPSSQMPTFAQAMGGTSGAVQPPASSGWNGLFDNPITRAIGAGYTHTVGGMQGMVMQMINPTGDQGFIKGFANPTVENQAYQNLKSHVANTINPIIQNDMSLIPGLHPTPAVGNAITNFGMDSVADPLSYVPVGPIAKVLGTGAKIASDAVGATPYIKAGLNAVANAPIIKPAIQGVQDTLGKMFTKNYGASPALVNILQNSEGAKAVDQHNILGSLSDLSQGHGLTPDELNQTGHVVEGTMQGTPAQQAFAQNWSNLAYHGPGGAPVGVPQTLEDSVSPVVSPASSTTPAFSPENLADAHNAINEINTHINGLDSGYQQAIGDQYQLLKNQLDNRGGVTQGSLMRDSTGAVTGRVGRISQNPEWYQNFYAQNGKVPSNKDLLNLAQQHVDNGYSDHGVQIPPSSNDYHATKAALVAVRDEINGSLGTGITPAIEGKMAQAGVKRTPAYQFEPVPPGAIGTHAMLNTPSAVNGQPLLRSQIDNHFAHMYDSVPADQVGTFPKQEYGGSGLSPDGTFNKPRTYSTLQDAQANGLKPILDPFQVAGHQLKQSSDALRNNEALAQIKSTPGLLFPKDPIDEIAKLAKTGRMDSAQITQAKQALGLTAKDMQPGGIVQSKVPQLSGYYIRKADEAALQDHLNPVQPKGLMGVANNLQDTYNKGYLLNPMPHMHNIGVNGVVLGGANPSYIKEAYSNIANGTHDPMYMRALQSGAINNPVGGKFADAISRTVAPSTGNVATQTVNGIKDAAKGITMGTTPLKDNIRAPFSPLYNASHNLLWNSDKAIRTALFRGAVEKGATDAQAAAHVNKFMVNYNNITPFERQYIKPLVPFYSWKKGNLPLQASQMVAQSPKYALYGHATNAVSQALSGQPAGANNKINSGQKLTDGSTTMIDPYNPMNDVTKAVGKGALPYLYSILSPAIKEGIDQGSSLSQAAGLNVQNKFPIYNPAAPLGWNIRAGLAHAINNLNPLSGSAVAGSVGNQSNLVNKLLGMPTNNKPNTSLLEAGTKLLGGFTSRDNPATDAKNLYYQNKDNKANLTKYRKILAKTK